MKTKHKPTSQTAQILSILKSGRRITMLDALSEVHCARLAARIADLRNEGYDIRTEMIEVESGKRVGQYRLAA